jgi:hypothetical protein
MIGPKDLLPIIMVSVRGGIIDLANPCACAARSASFKLDGRPAIQSASNFQGKQFLTNAFFTNEE